MFVFILQWEMISLKKLRLDSSQNGAKILCIVCIRGNGSIVYSAIYMSVAFTSEHRADSTLQHPGHLIKSWMHSTSGYCR